MSSLDPHNVTRDGRGFKQRGGDNVLFAEMSTMRKMSFLPVAPTNNDHLRSLQGYFGDIAHRGKGVASVRRDTKYIFVCFTNRCGSNFFANALSSSGFLNTGGEFFNADTIIDHCVNDGIGSIADYINWLVDREGRNGYLVAKTGIGNLEVLAKAGILDQILDISNFVMIERSDKLGQAISYDVALQTGRWTSQMKGQKNDDKLEFSYDRLTEIIDAITNQNRAFSCFFGLNGIIPALINYEQFEADPGYFIAYLSRFLGLPDVSFVRERLGLQKQSGQVNRLWRARYYQFGLKD